jgi:hypothetical protein
LQWKINRAMKNNLGKKIFTQNYIGAKGIPN